MHKSPPCISTGVLKNIIDLSGRGWFEVADSNQERLDHQVALIAQLVQIGVQIRGTWFPTHVNAIFQSFHECVR